MTKGSEMPILEIQSYLESVESNPSLYEEKNFDKRMEVIDFIGFQVIDRIEDLLPNIVHPHESILLKYRADKVRSQLEAIDRALFQRLHAAIRTGRYAGTAFKNLVYEYVDCRIDDNEHGNEIGYDNLDIFINGLSLFRTMPEQTKDLEPEMVSYQKTPARIVFELVEKVSFRKEDVFFDVGSGLGQVVMLVNLLTGITAKGVEFEPAFCDYARDCATELNLSGVTFINDDARKADYSEGTVFFMFTPFRGEILEEVLASLKKLSLRRKIMVITYGPCTARVAVESWLHAANPVDHHTYQLGYFSSD